MGGFAFSNPDDEEEKARILREFLAQDSPPDPSLDATAAIVQQADPKPDAPAPPPEAPARAAPAEPNTRALEYLAAREKDLAAPQVSAAPAAPSSSSGSGFDWGTVGALLLDALGNKGRGVGQITGAYVANKQAAEHEARVHQEHLAEIAARKANDPMTTYMQLMRLEQGDQRLQAGQTSAAQAQQRIDEALRMHKALADIESPEMQAKIALREQGAAGAARGRITTENDLADTSADTAARKSTATTNAVTNATNANPRALTKDQQEQLALERERLDESKRATAAAEGLRAETKRQTELNSFRTQTKDLLTAAQKGRELMAEINKGGHVHGLENYDYNAPGWAPGVDTQDIHNREIFQQLINPETKRYFGTAQSKGEESARDRAYATGTFSGEAARIEAVKTIMNSLESAVRAAGVGREAIAADVLKEYPGLEYLAPKLPEPPPAAVVITPPSSGGFEPKSAGSYGHSKATPATAGELGAPTTIDATDWRERYKRYLSGGGP